MSIYKCKYRIGLKDVAKSNQITNKAILEILENAGGRHSAEVGYGLNDIEKTHLSWVLLGWKVQIIKRPKYNEEISVETWPRNSNRAFSYRDYEIYDESGKLCIIATSKWTLINIKDGKLAELNSEVLSLYKDEGKSVFEDKNLPKLKEPENHTSQFCYKILRRDIDINNHVHNLYYLDFAHEVLPEDIYRGNECNNIEIMYKKQIKLGDEIICLYAKEDERNIVTIKSKNEENLHAIIRLY